jgi:tetratricopeptide (TPR) repeat protein
MKHARTLVLSLLLAAASVEPARAQQPPSALDESANAQADDLTRRGTELSKKHQWAEAEALFQKAWAIKHSYDIGGNLGLAELALGKHRDAAEHLGFGLKSFPANGKPSHRELLREALERARAEVEAVSITVNMRGAEISVDGKAVGTSPLAEDLFVDAGARVIEAKLEGYTSARQDVVAAKGTAQAVTLTLVPVKAVVPAPTVTATVKQPPPPLEGGGANRAVLVTGGVLAGAGIVMGAVLAALANGKAGAADQEHIAQEKSFGSDACAGKPARCNTLYGLRQDAATFGNIAAGSFIGAGVAGSATLIYALVAPGRKPKLGVRAIPIVTGSSGAVVFTGNW